METATHSQENLQANFFLSSEASGSKEVTGDTEEGSGSTQSVIEVEPGVDEIFAKAAREATKLYDTITNHDQLTQQQRDKVRLLIEKQRTALDIKISGQKPADGEDFDSLAKLLRKENNKLDALLEGKDVLFARFKATAICAEESIAQMKKIIAELEDES